MNTDNKIIKTTKTKTTKTIAQSRAIKTKWDERYKTMHVPNQVIDVLELNQHLLDGQGKSLDLACGLGGNALRLAELGYESHAWDISEQAIEKVREFAQERQLKIHAQQCDVSKTFPEAESFDLILVSRFLVRDLIPTLIRALKPGGLIFYQTFTRELLSELDDPESGPKIPQYRLQVNELQQLFCSLTLRYYREEGLSGDTSKGIRNEAMLVAQKLK